MSCIRTCSRSQAVAVGQARVWQQLFTSQCSPVSPDLPLRAAMRTRLAVKEWDLLMTVWLCGVSCLALAAPSSSGAPQPVS